MRKRLPTGISAFVSEGNGLALAASIDSDAGPGYRELRVLLEQDASGTPPASDARTLLLELRLYRVSPAIEFTVSKNIQVGTAGPDEFIVYVPRYFLWQFADLTIRENGRRLDELSIAGATMTTAGREDFTNDWSVRILMSSVRSHSSFSGAPLQGLPAMPAGFNRSYQNQIASSFPTTSLIIERPLAELPRSWLGYTSYDLMIVHVDELAMLHESDPTRWEALKRWTLAGGNLVVSDVGRDFAGLHDVERLFDLPHSIAIVDQPAHFSGWNTPSAIAYEDATNAQRGAVVTEPNLFRSNSIPMNDVPGVWREAGLGTILACRFSESNLAPQLAWLWMIDSIGVKRFKSSDRIGVSNQGENRGFYNWLIPDVGRVPAWPFLAIITLYAIFVGPVAYFLLRRRHKLYWLPALAGGTAALLTLGVAAYSIVGEGLATRVRIRSITHLNQKTGDAASWSRMTYFSGMAPGDGLDFPVDAAIVPIDPHGTANPDSPNRQQTLNWEDNSQRFAKGWLPSRSTVQFLAMRAGNSDARLELKPSEAPGSLAATNQLGAHVRMAVILDPTGRCFSIRDLAPGERRELTAAEMAVELDGLSNLINGQPLERPQALDAKTIFSARFGIRTWMQPKQNSNRLTVQLGTMEDFFVDLAVRSRIVPYRLTPGTYAAIVDRSIDLTTGIEEPTLEVGLNVLLGNW